MWREKTSGGKRGRIIFFIILLGGLYYFIELHVKITIIKWIGKIDKIVFEDAIYIYIFCIPGC